MDALIKKTAELLDAVASNFRQLGLPICDLAKAQYSLGEKESLLKCEHLKIKAIPITTENAQGVEWVCERCGKSIDFELSETEKAQSDGK